MAVVKNTYIRRGEVGNPRAKDAIRYMQHRPEREGERVTRPLFGPDVRESAHDDMVLATAVALWYAEYDTPAYQIPPGEMAAIWAGQDRPSYQKRRMTDEEIDAWWRGDPPTDVHTS